MAGFGLGGGGSEPVRRGGDFSGKLDAALPPVADPESSLAPEACRLEGAAADRLQHEAALLAVDAVLVERPHLALLEDSKGAA